MKTKYEQESGNSFNEASDIAIRLKVLAGEIYNAEVNMEWLKRQMFSATASGEYLDYLASQRGLVRRQATKAKGEMTFYISEPTNHDIIIPKGTVTATADSEPVRFVTTEDEEISAGNTLVSVYAEAEKAGSSGNIGIGKAVIAVSVPAEIERVINREKFENGTDEESDDELRLRIKDSYLNQANGTNAAYYKQLALSVDGIAKANVVAKERGVGTVNVYVAGKDSKVGTDVLEKAQSIISRERELNVDAAVRSAEFTDCDLDIIVWAKSGYTSDEVKAKCKAAFEKYIYSLPIGGNLFLTALGTKMIETGCIENYQYNTSMSDVVCGGSECFRPGNITIVVK